MLDCHSSVFADDSILSGAVSAIKTKFRENSSMVKGVDGSCSRGDPKRTGGHRGKKKARMHSATRALLDLVAS